MTAIADRLDPATRQRLLSRIADLEDLDHLIRQPAEQRPPEPPRPLAAIAKQEEEASS